MLVVCTSANSLIFEIQKLPQQKIWVFWGILMQVPHTRVRGRMHTINTSETEKAQTHTHTYIIYTYTGNIFGLPTFYFSHFSQANLFQEDNPRKMTH